MNKDQIEKFRILLEKEFNELKVELAEVGEKDIDHISNWSPTPEDDGGARLSEVGDSVKREEEFLNRSAILSDLEIRYHNVRLALKKIKGGQYGICEVSGKPIEFERLEVNPAARTNIENKDIELPPKL